MKVRFSVPSKTFLAGEYSILAGGPAIVVGTEPRFSMTFNTSGEGRIESVHPSSPAGLWIRSHRDDFAHVHGIFHDPHGGLGGFGASSAQFLMCYVWSLLCHGSMAQLAQGLDVERVWRDFQDTIQSAGQSASGADVVAQSLGSVAFLKMDPFHATSHNWPLSRFGFTLIRTGLKVATHEHLANLRDLQFKNLSASAQRAEESLKAGDDDSFLLAIQQFQRDLMGSQLVHPSTHQILDQLSRSPDILASKGCGALGADVIAVFHEKEGRERVLGFLAGIGIKSVADDRNLSAGLKFEVELEPRNWELNMRTLNV